ncbi:hypothetical protein GGR56DRAFT_665179 [Xylariaceae sp. FL0804]|nr:hypothetical protein GGR56DRAFT_665179 [Xylariaceae sp. FL0804]
MPPSLRPLQLPLLVEERRRQEEAAAQAEAIDGEASYPVYTTDSSSSDATSPVTPTFSARGHLRYSSSLSSFELATPGGSDDLPASPTQTTHSAGKRILDDVEEEPFEYDKLSYNEVYADDDVPDLFGLYDCLCDEPCIHRDADMTQSASSFYGSGRDVDYDLAYLSDSDFSLTSRSLRRKLRDGAESPFVGFSQKVGSRFPSFGRWRASKRPSVMGSPVSDSDGFDRQPTLSRAVSRAASSRSSSLSAPGRYRPDRANEPPLPPTPALSFYGSSDSVTMLGALDIEKANDALSSIQRERAQATTPLLPPMTTGASSEQPTAQPSPLESPTVVVSNEAEPQSPLVLSPPLSTKASISSIHQVLSTVDLPSMPAPDYWSENLGHANFTISPSPYKPETSSLASFRQLRSDWDSARVNYTKHLARTGEHYGITSKTYALTEAKWAEIDRSWREFHDEVAEAVVASGEASSCEKSVDAILTYSVPSMDDVGKFPQRGDEDIVGPMVREATMSSIGNLDRRRPRFWRQLSDRVGLRKA